MASFDLISVGFGHYIYLQFVPDWNRMRGESSLGRTEIVYYIHLESQEADV